MEILSAEQMRSVDRRTIEEHGVPGLLLMESAAAGIVARLLQDWPDAIAGGTLVVCGKGNNGGDGLAIARLLARRRLPVRALLLADPETLSGDAAVQWPAARGSGVELHVATDPDALAAHDDALRATPLLVDAMLGTGARGGARGLVADVAARLERRRGPVVAVDLPSGLDADATRFDGVAVRADATYTLCRPKPALLARANEPLVGRLVVVPIGIPDAAVRAEDAAWEWLSPQGLAALLPPRARDAHKGDFGHLLIVAGSRGKTGASILAGSAAIRCGAGLLTLAVPDSTLATVAAGRPEWMTAPLPETDDGAAAESAVAAARALASERDAVVVGPGLGAADSTGAFVRAFLLGLERPAIVDADALNAFPGARELRRDEAPLVLTPHPGEAGRLLEIPTAEVQKDRLGAAQRLAERTEATVVLKGDRTLVAEPDGRTAFNTTGNPGMSTGGTGDALSGMIGAFLARGLSGWDAARLGVWLHGTAGDLAARRCGEEGLAAGDLVDALPGAIAALHDDGVPGAW